MDAPRVNRRLLLFLVVFVAVAVLFWQARSSLWPFVLALALAYLIAPVVMRLHRAMPPRLGHHSLGRPLAIVAVYAGFIGIVAVGAVAIVPPVSRQAAELLHQAPELYRDVDARVNEWIAANRSVLPPQASAMVDRLLAGDLITRLAGPVLQALQRGGRATMGAVTGTISWVLGLVLIPIWLIYILKDTARVHRGALQLVPADIRPDAEAIRIICDRVLSAYIRGQLMIALILGTLFTVALIVLGVPYSLLLGFFAGVMALIPFIGSVLGAIVAVAVAFVTSAKLALLVLLAFLGIQQIDNMFISPRLQGRAVALNPAVIMVVLVIGQALIGPIGLLIAVPVTAIARDVVHYTYLRLGDDHPTAASALATVGYSERPTPVVPGERDAGA